MMSADIPSLSAFYKTLLTVPQYQDKQITIYHHSHRTCIVNSWYSESYAEALYNGRAIIWIHPKKHSLINGTDTTSTTCSSPNSHREHFPLLLTYCCSTWTSTIATSGHHTSAGINTRYSSYLSPSSVPYINNNGWITSPIWRLVKSFLFPLDVTNGCSVIKALSCASMLPRSSEESTTSGHVLLVHKLHAIFATFRKSSWILASCRASSLVSSMRYAAEESKKFFALFLAREATLWLNFLDLKITSSSSDSPLGA